MIIEHQDGTQPPLYVRRAENQQQQLPSMAQARAGSGLVSWLTQVFATEHRCCMPTDSRTWAATQTQHQGVDSTRIYICPECEQHWICDATVV